MSAPTGSVRSGVDDGGMAVKGVDDAAGVCPDRLPAGQREVRVVVVAVGNQPDVKAGCPLVQHGFVLLGDGHDGAGSGPGCLLVSAGGDRLARTLPGFLGVDGSLGALVPQIGVHWVLDDDDRDRQLRGQMRNQGGIDLDEVDPLGGEQAAQVGGELAGQSRCDMLRNHRDVGRRCRRGKGELAPKCPQTTAAPI